MAEFLPTQQRAFHFTASNCIGCHSCEAACSEKNGLPSHVSWRKVGYIETGSFPDYQRVNISMACNHCEDPVCLKGCPTRAYVKYSDTGAVIQDPDVCFGCQYCTWVCPYGAPAYNPDTGTVSKCNMCVDRLQIGLQPACVDACLGHALNFDEKDKLGGRFDGTDTTIPGFPDPAITKPNVRFQFDGEHGDRYTRPDSMNLAYAASNGDGHSPQVAIKEAGKGKSAPKLTWKSLQSDESPLVAFTLLAQTVVGMFALFVGADTVGGIPSTGIGVGLLAAMAGMLGYGLFTSTMHLGRPQYFYRAMNNLRHSWVSREILFMGGFMTLLLAYGATWGLHLLPSWMQTGLGVVTATFGILGLLCMVMIYRIPARPYWNHRHTGVAFFASGLILGPLGFAGVLMLAGNGNHGVVVVSLAVALMASLVARFSHRDHIAWLEARGDEAGASLELLNTEHRTAFALRKGLGWAVPVALMAALLVPSGATQGMLLALALALAVIGEALERFLFYLVVIATTMPGALFLKNKAFENLARETGLAADPCVGVAPNTHGPRELPSGGGAAAPQPLPMRPVLPLVSGKPVEEG